MVEIGTTHNVGSSLRVRLVTLPDQHLTRPCLAECVLAIALGSAVGRVDLSVQVQCVVAFKTYSVELLSSETLVCVLVGSHLWWLIDYVSSWGTTRTDTCILLGNGSIHSSLCHFKTKSRKVLIWCMWYVSKRKIHVHFIYLTKCCQHIWIQNVPTGTPIGEAYVVKISSEYQLFKCVYGMAQSDHPCLLCIRKKIDYGTQFSHKLFIISQFQLDMMKSMICNILLFFTWGESKPSFSPCWVFFMCPVCGRIWPGVCDVWCQYWLVWLRPMKTPNLNPDVMSHWIRSDTITRCKIEDDSCLALLDTSVTVNIITADYARMLDLPMGPLSDLREGLQGVKVPTNTFAGALGYVIVHIRFDEIKGYDEDQVCLVMEDNSKFASWVPMILGTPTTECVLNVMTESEITTFSCVAYS